MKYVAIDGDDVGCQLEYYALNNQAEALSRFSNTFRKTMDWIIRELRLKFQCNLVFCGGDNALLETHDRSLDTDTLEVLRRKFQSKCGKTLSMGIGSTTRGACLALLLSKVSGKNRITVSSE